MKGPENVKNAKGCATLFSPLGVVSVQDNFLVTFRLQGTVQPSRISVDWLWMRSELFKAVNVGEKLGQKLGHCGQNR